MITEKNRQKAFSVGTLALKWTKRKDIHTAFGHTGRVLSVCVCYTLTAQLARVSACSREIPAREFSVTLALFIGIGVDVMNGERVQRLFFPPHPFEEMFGLVIKWESDAATETKAVLTVVFLPNPFYFCFVKLNNQRYHIICCLFLRANRKWSVDDRCSF